MPVFRAVRSYRQLFGIFFLQLAAIFCPFKVLVHRPPYQRLCWQVIRTLCKEERPICKTTYLDHYWTQDGILLWRAQGMVVWLVLSFSYILLHAIDSDLPQMKVWFKHFIFPAALGSEISCRGLLWIILSVDCDTSLYSCNSWSQNPFIKSIQRKVNTF